MTMCITKQEWCAIRRQKLKTCLAILAKYKVWRRAGRAYKIMTTHTMCLQTMRDETCCKVTSLISIMKTAISDMHNKQFEIQLTNDRAQPLCKHTVGWLWSNVETTMLGKKRVLRKNLSDIAMMKVPRKRRQENKNTSAAYDGESQPNSTPFNSSHLLLLNAAQSTTASVPFPVLLSATARHTSTSCNVGKTS